MDGQQQEQEFLTEEDKMDKTTCEFIFNSLRRMKDQTLRQKARRAIMNTLMFWLNSDDVV